MPLLRGFQVLPNLDKIDSRIIHTITAGTSGTPFIYLLPFDFLCSNYFQTLIVAFYFYFNAMHTILNVGFLVRIYLFLLQSQEPSKHSSFEEDKRKVGSQHELFKKNH